MKKYSVLLLYPDYMSSVGPQTYLAHVKAKTVKDACKTAQEIACHDNCLDGDAGDDFMVLLCCLHWVEDIKP